MSIGAPVTFEIQRLDDLVSCFDATAADVFATACHVVDGRRAEAEALLIDVFLAARMAVEEGGAVILDHRWIVSTAVQHVARGGVGDVDTMAARERAAIELHLDGTMDPESIAAVLDLTVDAVTACIARHDDEAANGPSMGRELLRRSELWLDDATRRRARAAVRSGRRPERSGTATTVSPRAAAAASTPAVDDEADRPARPTGSLPRPHRSLIAIATVAVVLVSALVLTILPGDTAHPSATPNSGPAPTPTNRPDSSSAVSSAAVLDVAASDQGSASSPAGAPPTATATPLPDGGPTVGPGHVLDPPPTLFAWKGSEERVSPESAGRFQVWAEPDATRTTGRWMALVSMAIALSRTSIIPGGGRETIDGAAAVLSFDADGIPVLTVQPLDGGQFSITGGGFSPDELRQLAAGITLVDGVATFDPALDTLRDGLPVLLDAPSEYGGLPAQVLLGRRRTSTYVSDDGHHFIRLTTQSTTPDDIRIGELVLPPSSDSLAASSLKRRVQMGSLELSISSAPEEGATVGGRSSVRWHVGSDTLTMSGSTGLYQLLGAVTNVRAATADEWASMFQTQPTPIDDGGSRCDEFVQIGRTTTDDDSQWTVSICPEPLTARFDVRNFSVSGTMGQLPVDIDSLRPVREYVSMSSTSVVVMVTAPGTATGVLISVAGNPPMTLPLVPISDSEVFAAALTFREVNPYTVALVDEHGEVTRVLTP